MHANEVRGTPKLSVSCELEITIVIRFELTVTLFEGFLQS